MKAAACAGRFSASALLGLNSTCTSPASTTPSTLRPPRLSPPAMAFPSNRSKALATFKSVKRRLEVREEINGITLIEDFAHHPTAIRETLRALRAISFGTHLGSVRAALEHSPPQGARRRSRPEPPPRRSRCPCCRLSAAAHPRGRAPQPRRSCPRSQRRGTPAELHADADAIVAAIAPRLAPGDVVAILSNGGFDGIYEKLPARLRERLPAAGA